jgi:hypothetical protein
MSRHSFALLASLALLSACDKESTILQPDNSGSAALTIVNATNLTVHPYVGTTDVAAANLQALTAQAACAFVAPGSNTVVFKALDSSVVATSAAMTFEAGKRYTAILAANGGTNSVILVPETFTTLTSGNYGVRILNATGQSGDFFITTPTATAAGAPDFTLAANEITGGATGVNGYVTKGSTVSRVRMFNVGSVTLPNPAPSIVLDQLTTTNVTWTQGVTTIFAKNPSNVIIPFTTGQCQ